MGIEARLVAGSGGIFEVRLGDDLIFSKSKAGRFPESEEIIAALRSSL